jgi:glycosyltransferase involved in cell wall biosynthesis
MTIVIIDLYGLNGGAEKVMFNTYLALKSNNKIYCYLPEKSFLTKKIDDSDLFEFNSNIDIIHKIKLHRPDKIILNNKTSLKLLIPLKLLYPKVKYYYHSHGYFRNLFEQVIYTLLFLPALSKTICVSKSIIHNHNALLKINKKHILLYNGFNFNTQSVKKVKDQYINVFFWAQFRNWKGHLFLLDVIKKYNNSNIKFNFVASIQDAESEILYNELKEKVIEYNIQNKVSFHLNIENHIEFIKSKADISVSCSQLKDPLPTIIIESLSMGIPILATNLGGSKEILEDYPQMLTSISQNDFLNNLNNLIETLNQINSKDLINLYKDKFNINKYMISINKIMNK